MGGENKITLHCIALHCITLHFVALICIAFGFRATLEPQRMNFGQLQTNLKLTWTNLANWNHLEPTWNQLGNNLNQFCNLGPTWATLGRQLSCDQVCSSNDACLQWFSHFFMIFASSGQISLAGWPLINYKFSMKRIKKYTYKKYANAHTYNTNKYIYICIYNITYYLYI